MEKHQRTAAYGIAIRDNHVLLTRIARTEVLGETGLWMLPGGGIEHGEHPEEAVIRELAEETGYTVTVDRLLHAGSDHRQLDFPDTSVDWHNVYLTYAVTITGGQPSDEADGTMTTPTWFPLDGLPEMLPASRAILNRVLTDG
jgi:8-oxo-dGTP diphosphatase